MGRSGLFLLIEKLWYTCLQLVFLFPVLTLILMGGSGLTCVISSVVNNVINKNIQKHVSRNIMFSRRLQIIISSLSGLHCNTWDFKMSALPFFFFFPIMLFMELCRNRNQRVRRLKKTTNQPSLLSEQQVKCWQKRRPLSVCILSRFLIQISSGAGFA